MQSFARRSFFASCNIRMYDQSKTSLLLQTEVFSHLVNAYRSVITGLSLLQDWFKEKMAVRRSSEKNDSLKQNRKTVLLMRFWSWELVNQLARLEVYWKFTHWKITWKFTFCGVSRGRAKVDWGVGGEWPVRSFGGPAERGLWWRADHLVVLEVAQNSVDRWNLEGCNSLSGHRGGLPTEGMLSVLQTLSVISLSRISQAKMEGHSRCDQCSKLVLLSY